MSNFICPFCQFARFYKDGLRRGRQRFKCFNCRKTTLSHYPIKTNLTSQPEVLCNKTKQKASKAKIKDTLIKQFSFEDDVWDLRALRPIEANERVVKLYFNTISSDWLKILVKQYLLQEIRASTAISSVVGKLFLLRPFCNYLERQISIKNINEVNRKHILDFLTNYSQGKSSSHIQHLLGVLRDFFAQGNLNQWFNVSEHLIRQEDYPKRQRGTPKDIPTKVLEQIEDKLHKLPDPIARMWMVGFFCAMRLSELQLCSLDCLKSDTRGRWFITFWRRKTKDYHTLPVSRDSAKIIQEQQEYIREQFGDSFNYLFCDYVGLSDNNLTRLNLVPVARTANDDLLIRCINWLIKSEEIRDENNNLWHFTTSQLRDTRLTYLFETGHEFTVVSKWAGHKKYETTQKYVHVKDHTLREETEPIQIALLNIKGESIKLKDLPDTLHNSPNAHTIALPDDHINTPIYGFCGLPLNQGCPHWKACYTCPSFIARRELLPDYIKIRDQLKEKQFRAEQNGETVKVDQFKQQADSLDIVIARFEGVA